MAYSTLDDPALAAYTRASGWDEASLLAGIAYRAERMKQDQGIELDRVKEHYIRANRDVQQGYEDRGMFQSGTRRQAQNETLLDSRRDAMDIVRGTTNGIADLYHAGGWDLSSIYSNQADNQIAAIENPDYWL